MNAKTVVALSFLVCVWATACGAGSSIPGPVAAKVYVMAPDGKAASFTTYLASLVGKHGMTPNQGQATDNKGHSLYVLDAMSPSVRLRSENVLLSGHEDPALCGVYSEPHSDPGQYFISVSPSTQTADPRESRELLALIVKDLKADGYEVRSESVTCSPESKLENKG